MSGRNEVATYFHGAGGCILFIDYPTADELDISQPYTEQCKRACALFNDKAGADRIWKDIVYMTVGVTGQEVYINELKLDNLS